MTEYISREDVLKKAKSSISVPADNEWDCGYNTAMAEMQGFIKQLPAADVKRGKWKQVSTQVDEYNNHLYECTACRATDRHNINVNVPYCWHCGAEMEE